MQTTLTDNLANYDACALAEEIKARRLSAVEVLSAHYERIEQLNKRLNAVVTLDKSRAMRRAEQADRDLAAGKLWGPLHGVPITIKDSFQTEGLRTTVGHVAYKDFLPDKHAWVVEKLANAGAIVLGKTNCARLCSDIQTSNEVFGTTPNAWDLERTAGGSSGGEAVAVATGLSPLGIGSDTAGSIRIPSSYCGVFGMKTSTGKIPRAGLLPLQDDSHPRPDSLTAVGPIARSFRDLILCYRVLTDEWSASDGPSTAPKVFWTDTFDAQPIDDEVSRVVRESYPKLVDAGLNVVKVESPVPFGKLFAMYFRLSMFEFTPRENGKMVHRVFTLIESMRSLFRGGLNGGYRALKRDQAAMSQKFETFLSDCDCWVVPATPSVAFAHRKTGSPIPLTVNGRVVRHGYWAASIGLTYPFNILGNPSIVIPIGKSGEGMPVAIQVIGKLGQDLQLLNVASQIAAKIGRVELPSLR